MNPTITVTVEPCTELGHEVREVVERVRLVAHHDQVRARPSVGGTMLGDDGSVCRFSTRGPIVRTCSRPIARIGEIEHEACRIPGS